MAVLKYEDFLRETQTAPVVSATSPGYQPYQPQQEALPTTATLEQIQHEQDVTNLLHTIEARAEKQLWWFWFGVIACVILLSLSICIKLLFKRHFFSPILRNYLAWRLFLVIYWISVAILLILIVYIFNQEAYPILFMLVWLTNVLLGAFVLLGTISATVRFIAFGNKNLVH